MSIYEVIMLICFGAAWPASIYKSYTSRSAKGKSLVFLGILIVGYISGILNKLINYPGDWIIYLYFLNLAMISVDLFLYFRNKRLDVDAE